MGAGGSHPGVIVDGECPKTYRHQSGHPHLLGVPFRGLGGATLSRRPSRNPSTSAPLNRPHSQAAEARLDGYTWVMRAAGMTSDRDYCARPGRPTPACGPRDLRLVDTGYLNRLNSQDLPPKTSEAEREFEGSPEWSNAIERTGPDLLPGYSAPGRSTSWRRPRGGRLRQDADEGFQGARSDRLRLTSRGGVLSHHLFDPRGKSPTTTVPRRRRTPAAHVYGTPAPTRCVAKPPISENGRTIQCHRIMRASELRPAYPASCTCTWHRQVLETPHSPICVLGVGLAMSKSGLSATDAATRGLIRKIGTVSDPGLRPSRSFVQC